MSQDIKLLKKEVSNAKNLREVLELDLKYCGETGTSMEVQDIFRDLKYKYSMDGLKKVNLDSFAFRFYNFSMQGHLQIYLDTGTDERLIKHLPELSEHYDIQLTEDNVDVRQDVVVLDVKV